jgi:NTE family protein
MMPLKVRIFVAVIAVMFAGSTFVGIPEAYARTAATTNAPIVARLDSRTAATTTARTAAKANTRAELQLTPANEEVKRAMTEPKHHPTIALALGGGGIRGAVHIGVLRVFEREHIPIDYIAGCSMGSIIGGLYASGMTCDEIESVLLDRSMQKAYAPGTVTGHLFAIGFDKYILFFRNRPYAGLFNGQKFLKFLDKRLPENAKEIENTKIPFVAVVTSLCDGKSYKLAKGDLAHAILASSALPPVVRPVYINGNLYIDGGVRSNVPVVSAKQFHSDITIAIDADAQLKPMDCKKFTSVRNVARRVTDIVLNVADEQHLQKADLVIRPDIDGVPILSRRTKDVETAIKAGETAAEAALPAIREAMSAYKEKKAIPANGLRAQVK